MTALEPGRAVLLRLDGGAALAARVHSVDEDAVELVLLTPPLHPVPAGGAAEVEIASDRGIARIGARVLCHGARGSVRVARLPEAEQVLQRRDFFRVRTAVQVEVRGGGPGGPAGPARRAVTLDLSGGGLLLSGLPGLGVGDTAWVAIDLEDGGPPVEALAAVVREDAEGIRALRIASVAPRDEQRLVRYAFARQQRARLVRDA